MKTVKEISKLTGVSIRALRYYDEIGLLPPTGRSEAGYRLYDESALERLRAILFLKELDMPLETIREVVNNQDCDYKTVVKDYRSTLVQKINRFQGLLRLVDGLEAEEQHIDFKGFEEADALRVAEVIVSNGTGGNATACNAADCDADGARMDSAVVSEIERLVVSNMTEGTVGEELLQIYGSKEKYLAAVEDGEQNPEKTKALQEELKEIYFAFRDAKGDGERMLELAKRLEENTAKMYRTANARYLLLQVAEDYLSKGKTAQVLDGLYGREVTDTIGRAIKMYYGM